MKGKLFLILGPSGSGKGTVIQYLKDNFKEFVFPISCTTRKSRPHEKEGDIYFYLTKEEFKKKIEKGEFLEWAIVHADNYYGTLKKPILEALEAEKIVIREVDMQGVKSIRALLPKENVVSIFITTKSWEELKARILLRHQETEAELAKRYESYKKEREFASECDYIVENETGNPQECINKVIDIIKN